MKISTRRTNWASEMPASIGRSFFMACASCGAIEFCEPSGSESATRLAWARSIRYQGGASPLSSLRPKQSENARAGPLGSPSCRGAHPALTGFEPTVLCAASALAPVAEPVDAPDSKSLKLSSRERTLCLRRRTSKSKVAMNPYGFASHLRGLVIGCGWSSTPRVPSRSASQVDKAPSEAGEPVVHTGSHHVPMGVEVPAELGGRRRRPSR